MRNAKKNLRPMWYALYGEKQMIYDAQGRPTLEYQAGYEPPVQFSANLSAGNSDAEEQPFGASVQYDRIILTCDMQCPINEHSLIWVKSEPQFNRDGSIKAESADYEVAAAPLDSLNVLRIPIKRRAV